MCNDCWPIFYGTSENSLCKTVGHRDLVVTKFRAIRILHAMFSGDPNLWLVEWIKDLASYGLSMVCKMSPRARPQAGCPAGCGEGMGIQILNDQRLRREMLNLDSIFSNRQPNLQTGTWLSDRQQILNLLELGQNWKGSNPKAWGQHPMSLHKAVTSYHE